LMNVCREAGEQLADPNSFPAPPTGALADQTAKIKLVEDTESQITTDINAVLGMLIPSVVASIRADHSLNNAADICLPGLPANVAAGRAMRFYAGFLDMAKTLREKARQGPGLPDILITPDQRAKDMDIIHDRAQKDEVYCAGVRFGWWCIKRPGITEKVCDDGISDDHEQRYLADYYAQAKGPAAPTPPVTSGS